MADGKTPEKARRGRSRFTQRDVTRAFKAAQKAGVDARVVIATDGTLSIVSVTPEAARERIHPETNEWDDVLGNPTIPLRQ